MSDRDINKVISNIQKHMKKDEPYYAHSYNEKELIVIFKNKIFHVRPHVPTWTPIIKFERTLNIPEEQLDFWPNRFQDEKHYFKE